MLCKKCWAIMHLANNHYRFQGNYDCLWSCPNCRANCFEEVRNGKSFKEYWDSDNKTTFTIKCQHLRVNGVETTRKVKMDCPYCGGPCTPYVDEFVTTKTGNVQYFHAKCFLLALTPVRDPDKM